MSNGVVKLDDRNGGRKVAIPFRSEVCLDFEYQQPPGERPRPVCMVATNVVTGQTIRMWRDELIAQKRPPFDTGPDSLVVAYAAQADLACFRALGWQLPYNVLDLFAEHRVETNGLRLPCGNGLLGALACRGLAHIDVSQKEANRQLVIDRNEWTVGERREIVAYCESDVNGVIALLEEMKAAIAWGPALVRGRYAGAVATQYHTGVPIDVEPYSRLVRSWEPLKERLVRNVDEDFDVFEGTTFKVRRFERWLQSNGIAWPRLPSGELALNDDTFKRQALRYRQLRPLRELRATLGQLRLTGLAVGHDGRNRAQIWPFSAKTGRNQPSNTEFIFGPAKWMRGLIRPEEGHGLAYIDFAGQEIGIAAALSGDERMIDAYTSGDPYLAFAKMAGLAPADATAASHGIIREQCKVVMLALNYGAGQRSLASSLGMTMLEASELLRRHRSTFPQFWKWIDGTVTKAMLTNSMTSAFGWRLRVGGTPNPRSLANFPMQANGAEMLRIAAIAAMEAGVSVCAPVHDAFLISAPLDRLDEDVAHMREIMSKAGTAVTSGLAIRTEAQVVRYPDRFMPDGAQPMWDRVMRLLDEAEAAK